MIYGEQIDLDRLSSLDIIPLLWKYRQDRLKWQILPKITVTEICVEYVHRAVLNVEAAEPGDKPVLPSLGRGWFHDHQNSFYDW